MSRSRPGGVVLTLAELHARAAARFGPDPLRWAFACPACGDVATAADFLAAGAADPGRVGQECLGRHVAGRGCSWTAYGLVCGPWQVDLGTGRSLWSFPLADAPAEG